MMCSHMMALTCIAAAKAENSIYADAALAEVSILTGREYFFTPVVKFDQVKWEIHERQ